MTVPLAAALIGVPLGTPMSMPGWNEQSPFGRQRGPYGLVIGPLTGQIRPDDEASGAPPPDDEEGGGVAGRASAARIREAREALTAASCLASSANLLLSILIEESVERFESSAVESCDCDETSCAVTLCCRSVRARMTAVSAATWTWSLCVS